MRNFRKILFLCVAVIGVTSAFGFSSQTFAADDSSNGSSGPKGGSEDEEPFDPSVFDYEDNLPVPDWAIPFQEDPEFHWRDLLGDDFPEGAAGDSAKTLPFNPDKDGVYSDGTSEVPIPGNFGQPYGPPELFYFAFDPKTNSIRKLIPDEALRSIFFASDAQSEAAKDGVNAKPNGLPKSPTKDRPHKGGAQVLKGPTGGFDPDGKVDEYFSRLGRRHLRFEAYKGNDAITLVFVPDPFKSNSPYFSYAYSDASRQPGDPRPPKNLLKDLRIDVDPKAIGFGAFLLILGRAVVDAVNKASSFATGTLVIMVNPQGKENGPLALEEFEVEKYREKGASCYQFDSESGSYAVCCEKGERADDCNVEKITNG